MLAAGDIDALFTARAPTPAQPTSRSCGAV
jgi:hypothetical protein